MSLQQVCRAFYRHLCLDSFLLSDCCSPSSSSYSSFFSSSTTSICFSTKEIDSYNNYFINKRRGIHYIVMDVLGMSDHYNSILKSSLKPLKPSISIPISKDKSPLVESLKKKSSAALLFSPPSLSISSTEATTITITTPSTSLYTKKSKRTTPCYVSCFSPLDLPSEILICLLEFLSPADLWRLCQVSRAMQLKVIGFMSKMQRFKYSAVRVLHQEHLDTVLGSTLRGCTFYDRMTYEAFLPSPRLLLLIQAKNTGQVQSRSSYWLAQASYLVATITEGTKFEPKLENSPVMQGVCTEIIRKSERNSDSVPPSTSSSSEDSSVDPESLSLFSVSENTLSPLENVTPTIMPAVTSSSPINPFVLSSQDSNASQKQNQHWDPLEILPMDRFNAVVDLIFDPSIVQLNHRRAIINCARYVSASIDESFRNSVSVQEPVNLDFFEEFQTQYTIKTDPYLTMVTPINHDGEESELPLKEQVLAGDINSTVIAPPKKLHNYFQVLLWHRCMSDLIRLYNIIQNRHIDTSPSNSQCPKSTIIHMTQSETLYQQEHSQLDLTTNNSDIYPFCCKAHSLVFTAQYPTSFIPYSLRAGLRQMMRIIQAVTLKTNLPITILGQTGSTSTASRRIQCVGSSNRLNFCSGNAQPPSSAPSHHNRSKLIDDELVKRRHQIEEQTRQDNLTKQELLGLCHMACGLFLVDSQSSDGPSTIMSLLRQGTPWNKGVWREGEWQHDFINQQSNISQSLNNYPQNRVSMNDSRDMGRWQKLCVAAIQFLAHEDLAWGGNRANAELSRLRATSNATAWIYFE